MATKTGLDLLHERSFVDCDTLDEEVVKAFGPFHDCTANQALVVTELSKPGNQELIREALIIENKLLPRFPTVDCFQLAVEITTVKLALKIVPYIKGYVHVQANPEYAYDTGKTTANGIRIVHIFQYLAPWFDPTRICFQKPSTWEGLMACNTLEIAGVRTSATALFTFDQAILATEMGCTYVAPYVNQLNVRIEQQDVPAYRGPASSYDQIKEINDLHRVEHSQKLLSQCADIQRSFEDPPTRTKVIVSSLTSTKEVFALAGAHHITIPPELLQKLSVPGSTPETTSLFDAKPTIADEIMLIAKRKQVRYQPVRTVYAKDEAKYRAAFGQADGGAGVIKLTQAIGLFRKMQGELIRLVIQQHLMVQEENVNKQERRIICGPRQDLPPSGREEGDNDQNLQGSLNKEVEYSS
ncbi:uncharacterized protein BDV14DRAFT_197731 [Aspergillus stella-maris]|uniref:uncharacterized protein n=1 Tax=Aspergillus stella-maris TaxID=1810926 RepID=UPI003CCD3CCC